MNKLYKLMILLVMVSMASAAVYHVTTNPEARMFFSLEHDEVYPMQHLIHSDGFATNSLGLGLISSDTVLTKNIEHKNTDDKDYWAGIYITIECDEGIDIESHTHLGEIIYDGIEDFDHIAYTPPGRTVVECNNMSYVEVLSDTKVKIVPMAEETQFPASASRYSLLSFDFNNLAHGNYTVTIDTEKMP